MSDQIDVNYLADALNNKMDLPADKNQGQVDYVVEWKTPTSSDPTWYRKYKSGWVEQGGMIPNFSGTDSSVTVTFLKEFVDTSYTLTGSLSNSGYHSSLYCSATSSTTASFRRESNSGVSASGGRWRAEGQGA